MAVNVDGLGAAQSTTWVQRVSACPDDAQDKDDWRLMIKGQLANPVGGIA